MAIIRHVKMRERKREKNSQFYMANFFHFIQNCHGMVTNFFFCKKQKKVDYFIQMKKKSSQNYCSDDDY